MPLTLIFISGDKHISNSLEHECTVHGTLMNKRNEHYTTSLYTSTGKSNHTDLSLHSIVFAISSTHKHEENFKECDLANTRNKSSEEKMTDEKGCCNDFKEEFITNLVLTGTSSSSKRETERSHSASSEHLRENLPLVHV